MLVGAEGFEPPTLCSPDRGSLYSIDELSLSRQQIRARYPGATPRLLPSTLREHDRVSLHYAVRWTPATGHEALLSSLLCWLFRRELYMNWHLSWLVRHEAYFLTILGFEGYFRGLLHRLVCIKLNRSLRHICLQSDQSYTPLRRTIQYQMAQTSVWRLQSAAALVSRKAANF
jgi:hypothetical protein